MAGMDLTLSRKGDYVLRAAVFLASAEAAERRTLQDISRAMSIPRSYTAHILGLLVRAGLVEARAGRGGGYRLAASPEDVSMLEVIEIGEGGLVQRRCPLRGVPCHWGEQCAIHPTMSMAGDAIRGILRSTSVAEVAREDRRLAGEVPIPVGPRTARNRRR